MGDFFYQSAEFRVQSSEKDHPVASRHPSTGGELAGVFKKNKLKNLVIPAAAGIGSIKIKKRYFRIKKLKTVSSPGLCRAPRKLVFAWVTARGSRL